MIKESTSSVDPRLKRDTRYIQTVTNGSRMGDKLARLAQKLSDASFRADFDNQSTQKIIEEAMAGLVIGADEQLGFFRACKIAHKIAARITKIDQQRLTNTPLANTVAHLYLQFFLEGRRDSFFGLIFHLDKTGKNMATAMINWVDPNGRPVKGNVYM